MLFLVTIPLKLTSDEQESYSSTLTPPQLTKSHRHLKPGSRVKRKRATPRPDDDADADAEDDGLPEHVEKIYLSLQAATERGIIGKISWLPAPAFDDLDKLWLWRRGGEPSEPQTPGSGNAEAPRRMSKKGSVVAMFQSIDLGESEMLAKRLMSTFGLGSQFGSITLLPVEIQQPQLEMPMSESESAFFQSIKSRVLVDGILRATAEQAVFSFDFLMLLLVASILAAIGLATNNAVIVVASMLVSPLMGPILAVTFGVVVRDWPLVGTGLRSESGAIIVCVIVGFFIGMLMAPFTDVWGGWPTTEMLSRGEWSGLLVGLAIAVPSGVGVALSVLGNNTSSLVGVAISASLLPPAVNAGLCWAIAAVWDQLARNAASCEPGGAHVGPAPVPLINSSATLGSGSLPTSLGATLLGNATAAVSSGVVPVAELAAKYDFVCSDGQPYSRLDFVRLGGVSFLLTLLNIVCVFFAAILMYKLKEVAPLPGKTEFWAKTLPMARNYDRALKPEAKSSKDMELRLRALLGNRADIPGDMDPSSIMAAVRTFDERWRQDRSSVGGQRAHHTLHAPPIQQVATMRDLSDLMMAARGSSLADAQAGLLQGEAGRPGSLASGAVPSIGPTRMAVPESLAGLFGHLHHSSQSQAPSKDSTPVKKTGRKKR